MNMSFLSENILSIFAACIVLLLYIKIKKAYSYFTDRGIPQVEQTWSDLLHSMSFTAFTDLPCEMYEKCKGVDTPYIGFFKALISPTILIRDPSLVENILIKDFSYFQDHGLDLDTESNPLAGHLFNMKGDQWRTLRHKLVPAFSSGKLKRMLPIMEECADKLIQEMNQDSSLRKDTNLKDLFKKYSLSFIASAAFGIDPDSVKDPNCQFQKVLQQVIRPPISILLRFAVIFLFPSIAKMLKLRIFTKEVDEFMISLTKQSFEQRKKTGVKRNDFIQLLIELKEKGSVKLDIKDLEQDENEAADAMLSETAVSELELTDELLSAQVFVFLIGGFENIAYLVSITTYILSKHPEIQLKIREEVQQVKDKHGGLDYQALKDMNLLGASIDEALRLHPAIPVILRGSNKPYTLSDGTKIDKGVAVQIPGASLHRDSKYWADPDQFIPDRFLNGESIKPGTYMPFGDGPRICIAQRMALLVGKLMLAKLLLNYELQPSSKTKEPIKLIVTCGADNIGGFYGSFKDL